MPLLSGHPSSPSVKMMSWMFCCSAGLSTPSMSFVRYKKRCKPLTHAVKCHSTAANAIDIQCLKC